MTARRVFLILATLLIGVAVVPWGDFQGHTHWQKVGWIPFASPPIRLRDIVANLVLFAPFGAAVALNVNRSRAVLAAGVTALVLSASAESLQLFSHTRFPSATDLVCNTVGAVAGARFVQRRRVATHDGEAPER